MQIVTTTHIEMIDQIVASTRNAELELISIKDVERILCAKKSKLYADASCGLLTRPLHPGGTMSRWPKHEVVAVAALRVSGGDDDAVRALVGRLTEARATFAIDIFNGTAKA